MRLFILTLLLLPGCGPDVDLGAEMTGADVNAFAESLHAPSSAPVRSPWDDLRGEDGGPIATAYANGRAATANEFMDRFRYSKAGSRLDSLLAYTAGAVEQCLRAKETK